MSGQMIAYLISGVLLVIGVLFCSYAVLINCETKAERRMQTMGATIHVSTEVYTEISDNLKGAAAVSGQIAHIIPPHLADRLQTCIAKAQEAVGRMVIEKEETCVGAEKGRGAVAGQPGIRGS